MSQYWTDFSEYSTGSLPSDWSTRWNVATITVETLAGATGGQVLRLGNAPTDSAPHGVSWDAIDSDANRDNVETLYRFQFNGDVDILAMHRASGAQGSEDVYLAGVNFGQSISTLAEILSGAYSGNGNQSVGFTLTTGTWYWIRTRMNGSTLEVRVWEDGSSEPGTWNDDATNLTDITGVGWVGLLTFDHSSSIDVDIFSVGTNGDSAPSSDPGGATYTLTAEQGSYSLTGQTTGLLRTLRLISEQGSYTYTGQTTNLLKTYLLAAEQGSYTIVGADGELLETFILEAESGDYTLTGQETQFFKTLKLIAEQGSYTVSGQTTNLLRNLLLTAEQGSYTLSGQDAILSAVANHILTAESGNYSLTGNDTDFLRSLILEAEQGSYTLTGQQTDLLRKLLLSAETGNYTLTGQDVALTVEDSPEILILMSAIVSSLELNSTTTTELDLDSTV